jgi:hypothetical protein
MKHKQSTLLAALACALFAVALAPIASTASAGYGYDLDEEAQQWYDFAHDKAQEINLLHIRTTHSIEQKVHSAYRRILNSCCPLRTRCDNTRTSAKRRSLARRARFNIGKCVWEAQMELDACYEDARQQLEAAGYGYFVPHIYNPYRTTQRWTVEQQRHSNHVIGCAVNCVTDGLPY